MWQVSIGREFKVCLKTVKSKGQILSFKITRLVQKGRCWERLQYKSHKYQTIKIYKDREKTQDIQDTLSVHTYRSGIFDNNAQ